MSWPLVKLSEVAEINPRFPKNVDESQVVTFLPMAAVSDQGQILEQEKRILGETRKGFTYFEKDDVVIAKITPCFENGKAAFLDNLETQIGFGTTEFHVIRPNIEKLDGKYLFYLVWNKRFRHLGERNMSGSAGQKRVPSDFLKDLKIPLPPLDEQKRIAAILDKADAIRRKRQKAIQLADDFLRSVFLDMFGDPVTWNENVVPKGWTVKRIEEISLLKRGYDLPKQSRLEGNIPIYAANGVTGTHNEFKVKGPGVITGRSGTIGKVIYSENDFWPLNTALYVTNFYGNNPKYIEWYLRFLNLERYVQGAGVPTLNRNLFLKEVSAVPPKAEQDRFEVICKLVSQLIFKNVDFNKKELFNSLSQKAFAGEL